MRIPAVHPITDLARDAKGLVERMRARGEPVIITQRGRDVAVLLPVEVYREMVERATAHRVPGLRFTSPAQADDFRLEMTEDTEGRVA
jgi:prevent-host-death family protein